MIVNDFLVEEFIKCGGSIVKSAGDRIMFKYDEKIFLSVYEFVEYYKLNYYVFLRKLKNGVPIKDIINSAKHVVDHKGIEYPTIKKMCETYGISQSLFSNRVKRKWDLEAALTTAPGALKKD